MQRSAKGFCRYITMKNAISFDPFSDRLARDIRNGLSTAFARAVYTLNSSRLEESVATWEQSEIPQPMAAYINDRIRRYRSVLDQIHSENEIDPRRQSLAAWNEQLYFEVHEILEAIWQPATGDRRKALQGLILAAGVGEHRQYGHTTAAERLSGKADQLIRRYRRPHLEFIDNLEDLLDWLQNWNASPPGLRPAEDLKI